MFSYVFFIFSILWICLVNCNYFVTVFNNKYGNFPNLQENVGFIHKNFPNDIVLVFVKTIEKNNIFEKMKYWEKVHLIDISAALLFNSKDDLNLTQSFKFGIISYVFRNFYLNKNSESVFFFENNFEISKYQPSVKSLLQGVSSSSDSHLFITKGMYERIEFDHVSGHIETELNSIRINLKINEKDPRTNYRCSVKFKPLHLTPLFFDHKRKKGDFLNWAIMIPTIITKSQLATNVFFNVTLKSLKNTITEEEAKKFNITFYFGLDNDDLLRKNSKLKIAHEFTVKKMFYNTPNIKVKYYFYPKSDSVVFLWNALFVEAFIDNNDLFLQLNDDTEIYQPGWMSKAFEIYKNSFDGIIGFNAKEWKCKIFTQTIVSRKHFLNHKGSFYPVVFHNSMSDIWITEYYKKNRICLLNVETNNHFSKTRYKKCKFDRKVLKKLLGTFDTKY